MRIVDLHCDTLYKNVTENIPLDYKRNEVLFNTAPENRKLQCYAIWLPDTYTGAQAEQTVFTAAKRLESECKRLGIKLLKRGEPFKKEFESHTNTAFFTIENGKALNGKLENVKAFADLGVRMMTLTWNARNLLGDGADVENGQGLTAFGREVIPEMERRGMIVDISHAGEKLFWDVAEAAKKPIVASHSNAFSVTGHRRNLRDDQIKEIINRKGLFGLNFHNAFLNNDPEKATVNDVLRHAELFLSLGGSDCLCFGSDFDGGTLPDDFQNSRVYDKIYTELLRHNYEEELIRKIFYGNALNFFENFDNQ